MMPMPSSLTMGPWIYLSVPAVFLATLPAVYSIVVSSVLPTRIGALRNKRICLLIAHPDDEAMFFAPTLQALARPDTGNHVKILCLSAGDAEGLGETRKGELTKSALMLGIRHEDDVFVIESDDFEDSASVTWDKSKISSLLLNGFAPHHRESPPPPPKIDVLVTFDEHGVSSHPNHISLYHGAREFFEKLAESVGSGRGNGEGPPPPPVDMYTLTSVGFLRKYTGILDIFATMATAGRLSPKPGDGAGAAEVDHEKRNEDAETGGPRPDGLVFASRLVGDGGAATARAAMTQAHKSQMVWFRWGWIWLSRYMVLNQLKREVL